MAFTIDVNGSARRVDVDGDTPLLWVLRDVLGMTGTKFGCGVALCGACTVHIDGIATRSCITSVDSIGKSRITTIEAIGATDAGGRRCDRPGRWREPCWYRRRLNAGASIRRLAGHKAAKCFTRRRREGSNTASLPPMPPAGQFRTT